MGSKSNFDLPLLHFARLFFSQLAIFMHAKRICTPLIASLCHSSPFAACSAIMQLQFRINCSFVPQGCPFCTHCSRSEKKNIPALWAAAFTAEATAARFNCSRLWTFEWNALYVHSNVIAHPLNAFFLADFGFLLIPFNSTSKVPSSIRYKILKPLWLCHFTIIDLVCAVSKRFYFVISLYVMLSK